MILLQLLLSYALAQDDSYTYFISRKAPAHAICDLDQVSVPQKFGESCLIYPGVRYYEYDVCVYRVECKVIEWR